MWFIYSDLFFELCASFTWISSLKLLWESNWNFSNLTGAQALLACSLLTSVSSPNTWHHNFGAAEKLILPEMLTAVLYIQILQKTQSQESYFMQKVKNKTSWHCCITNKKQLSKKGGDCFVQLRTYKRLDLHLINWKNQKNSVSVTITVWETQLEHSETFPSIN